MHPSTEGHGVRITHIVVGGNGLIVSLLQVLLTELDGAIKEYFPLVNQAGWKDPSWRALYGEPLN